ncbi:MAG: class I SAM-dependent methyltransferase [Lachnospiraceae bacterium]|nr:class I SAM-dependent methyltransferase [Lachnospiraceae bacterium]
MNDNYNLEYKILKIESMLTDLYENGLLEKKKCIVCGCEVNVFEPYLHDKRSLRPDAQCPYCKSMERHRTYWRIISEWINRNAENPNTKILHFAPEKGISDNLKKCPNIDYYPVDYNSDYKYGIREKVDIMDIPYSNKEFDYIICNHVLEHVVDDNLAISELYRVLKPGGEALINVPITKSIFETIEKEEYNTPELRSKYYGQRDHLRRYGMDFKNRLKMAGFLVKDYYPNHEMSEKDIRKFGVKKDELVFLCSK